MEVQNTLGYGFSEVIYKDALEIEFLEGDVEYTREVEFGVEYKGNTLHRKFIADFACFNKIILEVKSCNKGILDDHIAQTLNYLRASGLAIGLIINFGKRRLEYRRLVF